MNEAAEIHTAGDAKRYLQRIRWLRMRMESAALQAVHYREMATGITAALSPDKVSSGGLPGSRVEDAVSRIVDISQAADALSQDLMIRIAEARRIMVMMEDEREMTVLDLRYFGFRSWNSIQIAMGYADASSVFRIHARALKSFSDAAKKAMKNQ